MFAEEDPAQERRKRRGKYLGILGLLLMFGSGLSIILVPPELWQYLLIPLVFGTGLVVFGYLLVR